MPQVRVMGDDADHVESVVVALLKLIADSPDLFAGDPTRLGHRGGGGRVVFDVSAAPNARVIRVERAERVDDSPARRRPRSAGPLALPPGESGGTPWYHLCNEEAITPDEAARVLFHFGAEGGVEAGDGIKRLIRAIAGADIPNRALFALGFPGYTAAVTLAQLTEDGIARLQEIAARGRE